MNIGICRVQKIPAPKDIAGIQLHNRRERDHSNTNPDIDRARSSENYSIIVKPIGEGCKILSCFGKGLQDTGKSYNALIDERIEAGYTGKRAVRKDAVRCCEVLFTASGDFFDQHPDRREAFFMECVVFAAKRFGAANIIAATVHMDEDTPHMHLDFVPLTADGRLSAKSVLGGRKEMQQLQDDFFEQVGKKFGLERGTRADLDDPDADRPRKHLTVRELKAETEAQLSEQQQLIQQQQEILDRMQEQEQQQLAAAEAQLAEQQKKLEQMQEQGRRTEANNRRHEEYFDKLMHEQGEAVRKASEAKAQQQMAESETTALDQEILAKKGQLSLLDTQCRIAAGELQKTMELQAKAAKKHKVGSIFGGDTVTCDKSAYEDLVLTCSTVKETMTTARKLMIAVEERARQLDEQAAEIEPLHTQRQIALRSAQAEKEKYERLQQEESQLIEQRAAELADTRIGALFKKVPDSRRERLEDFCRGLRLSDGRTALEAFEDLEQQLQKQLQQQYRQQGRGGRTL